MYKMIIADDEINICIGLKDSISWSPLDVEVVGIAENGRQAFELFKQHHPSIVIADINMPDMDGIELLSRIKKLDASAIVIFISAHSKFSYAQKAVQLGAFNYLIKPFFEDDLVQAVKQAIVVLKERDSIKKMLKIANVTREQYRKDMLLLVARGILPYHEAVQKTLTHSVGLDISSSRCFGMLIRFDSGSVAAKSLLRQQLHILENRISTETTGLAILETALDEFLVIVFFMPGQELSLSTLYPRFSHKIYDLPYQVQIGISLEHPAIDGFSKVYMECCSALVALTVQAPSSNEYYFEKIDAKNLLIIREEDYYRQIIEAINQDKPDTFQDICYKLFLQLCQAGIIYSIFDYYMTFKSGLHYIILKLDWRIPNEKLYQRMEYYNAHMRDKLEISILKCFTLTVTTLHELYEEYKESAMATNLIINKAIDYIQNNYSQNFSLAELSDKLYITPNYLSRLFREETGHSFSHYLAYHRIEVAKKMLKSGQFKIYEIALKIGYSDAQHFAKQFKKIVGITPKEYSNSFLI